MIPGPDCVISCPKCGALARYSTIMSGNTFGQTCWTDSGWFAPMLPRPPAVTRCSQCAAFYWLRDASKVGSVDWLGKPPRFIPDEGLEFGLMDIDIDRLDRVRSLTEQEYLDAIEAGLSEDREEEIFLRTKAWQSANDIYRECSPTCTFPTVTECSEYASANLDCLQQLLADKAAGRNGWQDIDAALLRGEILRELGSFDEAIRLLEGSPASQHPVADQIRQLAINMDPLVRPVTPCREPDDPFEQAPFDAKITPLHQAAKYGLIDHAQMFIERGDDVNAKTAVFDEETAMTVAAKFGHADIVKLLLVSGADPNAGRGPACPPFLEAAQNGHVSVVESLLRDVSKKSLDRALYCAAQRGHVDVVRLLIREGADVNYDDGYDTVLGAAAVHGDVQLLEMLICEGAKVNTDGERSPLHQACKYHLRNVAEILIASGAKMDIWAAAMLGDTAGVERMLSGRPEALGESFGMNEEALLHLAAASGSLELVTFLVEHGAFVNHPDCYGNTPLDRAESKGHEEIVRILAERGGRSRQDSEHGG